MISSMIYCATYQSQWWPCVLENSNMFDKPQKQATVKADWWSVYATCLMDSMHMYRGVATYLKMKGLKYVCSRYPSHGVWVAHCTRNFRYYNWHGDYCNRIFDCSIRMHWSFKSGGQGTTNILSGPGPHLEMPLGMRISVPI